MKNAEATAIGGVPTVDGGKKKVEKKEEKEQKKEVKSVQKVSKKASGGKVDLIKKYQSHKEDTGSTEVQIAILTKKISELTKHLKEHKKDFDSRRGLLMMVGKRRRLLNYLKKTEEDKYLKLIADLGLRK
jgi:small subunit ribosomal protein S15